MGLFNSNRMGKRIEKVILLAADSEATNLGEIPNCLQLTRSGRTIIESQIQTLGLYNLERSNITIVIGEKGPWKNNNLSEELKNDGIRFILNENNDKNTSADSLKLAIQEIPVDYTGDILIIYSDLVFNTKYLDTIFSDPSNCALVRTVESLKDKGLVIATQKQPLPFPWKVFHGIIKVSFSDLKNLKSSKKEYENAITAVLDYTSLNFIDVTKTDQGIEGSTNKSFDLNGGSYASLIKKLVVRKEATGPGSEKLINELKWLQKFSQILPEKFPSVVEFSIKENNVWYEMPYFDLPNIRKAILTFQISPKDVIELTKSILEFNFNNLYSNVIGFPDKKWLKKAHFDRVYFRLFEVFNYSIQFKNLISSDRISINGTVYKNLPECFSELLKIKEIEELTMPEALVDIHGDLHFQNILFRQENQQFILADPRGELEGSDLFYDLGKLLHSVNGKYDLIHTNQFELNIDSSKDCYDCHLNFINPTIQSIYDQLNVQIMNLLESYPKISNQNFWKERILFNECMHFCSVSTFHINRYDDEYRSMAMYLTGVILINKFLQLPTVTNLKKNTEPLYYFKSKKDFLNQLINNCPNEN